MRTKTLLLTATLGAAGIASSFAQTPVYSQNVVGYVNVQAPAGFSLIANPLDNKTGNNLNTILPGVPVGTTVYKYDGATGFTSSVNFGTWTPDLILAPGEGAFIQLAAPATLTFVGEVTLGRHRTIKYRRGSRFRVHLFRNPTNWRPCNSPLTWVIRFISIAAARMYPRRFLGLGFPMQSPRLVKRSSSTKVQRLPGRETSRFHKDRTPTKKHNLLFDSSLNGRTTLI